MTIELALVISAVSLAFGLYSGIASMKRSHKADSQQEAAQMTEVIVKLEYIKDGITEIKTEIGDIKSESKEFRDRLTIVEQSLKAVWKRIDELTGGKQN